MEQEKAVKVGEHTQNIDKHWHDLTLEDGISLPENFTFPFYYEPHPAALQAVDKLIQHLNTQPDYGHNFGLNGEERGIGKMFGVLVVKDQHNNLGYLAAYSGKLGNSSDTPYFVPPLFDMLVDGEYFSEGMKRLSALNARVDALKVKPKMLAAKLFWENIETESEVLIKAKKEANKIAKTRRDKLRKEAANWAPEPLAELEEQLRTESIKNNYNLKHLIKSCEQNIAYAKEVYFQEKKELDELKKERSAYSNHLQQWLFKQYNFLNAKGEVKELSSIFTTTSYGIPPSGAGDCAAPKLLQYAYQHNYKPICMAEFWWGKSPNSEIRNHQYFYPSCKGKCEPILGHMLQGLKVDPNPMLVNPAEGQKLEILFEDEHLVVVNKPADFLSVPGKTIHDSVYHRMRVKYPLATGPLIVHRLDMSTSGILLIPLTKRAHEHIQKQFISRKIKKRYLALLDGDVKENTGVIDLPMTGDLLDRPRQKVCFKEGKTAQTKWELIEKVNGKSRVYFYPITGRTHQLRVHAAHKNGLNAPIVGDDLYGVKTNRLHLHAQSITFQHPIFKTEINIETEHPF